MNKTCEDILSLLQPWLDHELSPKDAQLVKEHLAVCPSCEKVFTAHAALRDELSLLGSITPPPDLHADALHLLLREEKKMKTKKLTWKAFSAAAAAFVLLCIGAVVINNMSPYANQTPQLFSGTTSQKNTEINDTAYDMGISDDGAVIEEQEVSMETPSSAPETAISGGNGQNDAKAMDVNGRAQTTNAPKIIKTGDAQITTQTFADDLAFLHQQVESLGGYFEEERTGGDPVEEDQFANRYAHLVARIPQEHFDAFYQTLQGYGKHVTLYTNRRDISEQYYDTDGRLKTYLTQQARLQALMEKAVKIEDLIALESEMQRVQYEIESLSGTLRMWDGQVAYATFSLSLREVRPTDRVLPPDPTIFERMENAFYSAINAFVRGLENALVGFVSILPVLIICLPILLVVFFVARGVVKRNKAHALLVDSSKSSDEDDQ